MSEALAWIEPILRPVIALGTLVTSGGVIALYSANRKSKAELTALENTADDKLHLHYAAELKSLRTQLVTSGEAGATRAQAAEERYIAGMAAAELRHAQAQEAAERRFSVAMDAAAEREQACEDRVRELRDEVRGLSEEIVGLRRNVGQQGRSAIVLASQVPNLSIAEAADRAADALETIDHRQRDLPHHEMEPDQ